MAWTDQLNIKAKIGQLLMVGFEGSEFSPKLKNFLDQYRPGGIILFARNFIDPPQLTELCRQLHKWAAEQSPPIPLLIATDHEGGRVQRFKKDFTILRPPAEIKTPEEAYKTGKLIGDELTAAGVNMNMMPLLDINTNPDNPIIADRAFGDTPGRVIELALPFIGGMREEGVIAVGKHFPGHGDTSKDSHKTMPVVDAPQETLYNRELVPFQAAFRAGLSAVMTAHVLYPAWDEDNPATLSTFILNGILRREMNFDGIIISDDMLMGALESDTIGATACQAFMTGVDLFIIGAEADTQVQIFDSLLAACENDMLAGKRLEEALRRLFKLKRKFLLKD